MSDKCDCKDCAFRGMELCEHRKLMDENAKLREALKPVLACKCNFDISWAFNDGTLLAYAVPMYDAVRKAQAIMKGETK